MEGMTQVLSRIAEIRAQFPATVQPTATRSASAWSSAAADAGLTTTDGQANGASAPSLATDPLSGLGAATDGSPAGRAAAAKAAEYLGVPYLWGGTDPTKGLDCSGFTQLVYKSQGIDLPRVSAQQATAGRAVASLNEARPGDLLFFDYSPTRPGIDHVGIYVGNGKMIAAPQPGDVVKVQSAGQPTVIRRVVPEGSG
ncbi:NlpC/P60 family protein [Blastococcus sp. TF02-8]|uniref:C40 family peptidase n=1 Tax=Blastococcus sp. TF02-8 TaxID=2250574 RepID=UPI000DEBE066|nr:C40 family peptidase [Blastococcus sp. TF02-8]RBY97528.1 NlpC/P60 family protein [Blastococcus sp. TF02-8]